MVTYGSHNYIVNNYFRVARSLAHAEPETLLKDDAKGIYAASILMSVSAVEAFINIFGRLWVGQTPAFEHSDKINNDLLKKRFITQKIKEWPVLFFGKKLDLSQGIGQAFIELVDKRNMLMHYKSEHHSMEFEDFTINGVVDVSVFNHLTAKDATDAIEVSENFIAIWLKLQGFDSEHVNATTAMWTGNIEFKAI